MSTTIAAECHNGATNNCDPLVTTRNPVVELTSSKVTSPPTTGASISKLQPTPTLRPDTGAIDHRPRVETSTVMDPESLSTLVRVTTTEIQPESVTSETAASSKPYETQRVEVSVTSTPAQHHELTSGVSVTLTEQTASSSSPEPPSTDVITESQQRSSSNPPTESYLAMTSSPPSTVQITTRVISPPEYIPPTPSATSGHRRPCGRNTGADDSNPDADVSSIEASDAGGDQKDACSQHSRATEVPTGDDSTIGSLHAAETTTAMASSATSYVSVDQSVQVTSDESSTTAFTLAVRTTTLLSSANQNQITDAAAGNGVVDEDMGRPSWVATSTPVTTTTATPIRLLDDVDDADADETKPRTTFSTGGYIQHDTIAVMPCRIDYSFILTGDSYYNSAAIYKYKGIP